MHELGIARNIVAIVCERAGTTPVKRVTLEIGALSGVEARAIAFCFPIVAEGSTCPCGFSISAWYDWVRAALATPA